jgi:pyruvate dehydrogenase E2 component (dihydrolipoamide acetyltransferase)
VKEGDLIKVGTLLLSVAEEGSAAPAPRAIDATIGDEEPEAAPARTAVAAAPARVQAAPTGLSLEAPTGPQPAASPTVRKIARELGIDLRRVQGSASGGRVVIEDVARYIQWLQETALGARAGSAAPASAAVPASPAIVNFAKWGPVQTKKLTTLRKTISNKMVESWTHVPHVTQFDEADVTAIIRSSMRACRKRRTS